MIKLLKLIFPIIILIASGNSYGGNFYYPVSSPEYRFIYDVIDRDLILLHDGNHLGETTGPYAFKIESDCLPSIGYGGGPFDRYKIRTYALLSEKVSSIRYQETNAYTAARGILAAQPHDNLYLYLNFLLDQELDESPDYTGKKWRGFAGEIENAFVFYHRGRFTLQAGRFASFWGPNRESLILSETARPMDAVALRYTWGFFQYTFQTGKLDRLRRSDENEAVFENRYFSGHRIDLRLHRNFYLGLFETVIYGGPGRPLEFAYLNPFLFYHAYQLNEDYNDNTFIGFDFAWYLYRNNKIYGQFLIDDLQIDNKVRGDNEPNEIGLLIGIHTARLYEYYELKAEYLAITNRTYNQVLLRNRYVNRGNLLGNEFGPDVDRLILELSRWLDPVQRLTLGLEYRRKGEGRYDDPWTQPWMDVNNYAEPFPTGIVEKTFKPSLGFTGFVRDYFFLECEAGVEFVDNYRHLDGRSETLPYFNFRLTAMLYSLFKFSHPGS